MSNQSLLLKQKNDFDWFEKPKKIAQVIEEQSGDFSDFIDVYEAHITNLISVTRSDLRNIKLIKTSQLDQGEFLEKLKMNFQEKMDSL